MQILRTEALGLVALALAVLLWVLDKSGMNVPAGVITITGCAAALMLAVGLFHPLTWLISHLPVPRPETLSAVILAFLVGTGMTWWVIRPSGEINWETFRKAEVIGQSFTAEDVPLDGMSYSN